MADDRDDSMGGAPRRGASRQLMPGDVLRDDDDEEPTRDPNSAPHPRPRTVQHPDVPPNVPLPEDPDVTQVGRLPRNPVTGQVPDGALDVVPIGNGAPTVQLPSLADEATQVRIDPELTAVRAPPPAPPPPPSATPPPKRETAPATPSAPGNVKLATAEDLGMSGADLQDEPLLKWIAIGLGLMVFVAIMFALAALLVFAMSQA